jgi:4-carboxymuconolactone decarboxylase
VDDDALRTGVAIRREMFGEEFTDRQIGLARRERSMITLGVLCAMGRSKELRVHVKGALANGVTPLEIREILLHTMVYAGVPLGVDAFHNAAESLAEEGVDLNAL